MGLLLLLLRRRSSVSHCREREATTAPKFRVGFPRGNAGTQVYPALSPIMLQENVYLQIYTSRNRR